MSIDQDIVDSTETLKADVTITHAIVHGDETSVVQTEGGPVPSHKKVATDGYQYFVDALRPRVSDINQHARLVTDAASETNSARNEAVKAKNDAVAIVHNDEGSLTPKPGAYAVADSNGHYDIGWTPLLQAMYPYSGIIGSVDKRNVFYIAGESIDWINRFRFGDQLAFNINGRFVQVHRKLIELNEAESTADRAESYDDVFLDWDGKISAFRSINAYKTTTGYDRDSISSEHGYSKVQTGLYKKDNTYALLLCRVARRNQFIWHHFYNPEGSASACVRTADGKTGGAYINQTLSTAKDTGQGGYVGITSKEDCFLLGDNYDKPWKKGKYPDTGNIRSSSTWKNGRPDNKFFDSIYSDDVTPLYYSSKKVIDRQSLLFDSFNFAVSGGTFSGAEGTKITLPFQGLSSWKKGSSRPDVVPEIIDEYNFKPKQNGSGFYKSFPFVKGKSYIVHCDIVGDTSHIIELKNSKSASGAAPTFATSKNGVLKGSFILDDGLLISEYSGGIYLRFASGDLDKNILINNFSISMFEHSTSRPQFLETDIIGNLNQLPSEWKNKYIPGNMLILNEDGESLIPDGTRKFYKASRKCIDCYLILASNDKGETWRDVTGSGGEGSWKDGLQSSDNGQYSTLQKNEIRLIFYLTSANPFELSNTKGCHALSEKCLIGITSDRKYGCLIGSHLISKIAISDHYPRLEIIQSAAIAYNSRIRAINKYIPPINKPNDRLRTNGESTIKILPYLTEIDKRFSIVLVYKEVKLKTTENISGDDNKFDIIDFQTVLTDQNGEQVIAGQKITETPFQSDGIAY